MTAPNSPTYLVALSSRGAIDRQWLSLFSRPIDSLVNGHYKQKGIARASIQQLMWLLLLLLLHSPACWTLELSASYSERQDDLVSNNLQDTLRRTNQFLDVRFSEGVFIGGGAVCASACNLSALSCQQASANCTQATHQCLTLGTRTFSTQ